MPQIMAVLNALADPAFFLKDGVITRCNSACGRIHLAPGDTVPELSGSLPEGNCHMAATVAGQEWDATVLPQDDEQLVLLKTPPSDLVLLDAVARGFQQPMTSILTAGSDLLTQLEELEDEDLQQSSASVSRGLFRLLRNLSVMMEFCRLQTGQKVLYLQKTKIKTFFDKQAVLWADMLQDAGVKLDYHGPKKEFNGNLDRNLVQRAVLGLLANAAIYGHSGEPVGLTVSYLAGRVKISVTNQGKPMDPEVFATAFSRYEHVSPTDDSRWGAGFGLPVAQLIARRHGGSVMLESGENTTTVTMVLKLDLPESESLQTPLWDPSHHYDPAYVELSGVLPASSYDSRRVEL